MIINTVVKAAVDRFFKTEQIVFFYAGRRVETLSALLSGLEKTCNSCFLCACLVVPAHFAYAGSTPPDSGRVIQDQKERPNEPGLDDASVIELPQSNGPVYQQESGLRVKINSVSIQGNTLFSGSTLRSVLDDTIGEELSLADMRWMAARLTAFYRENGYIFARAYLPPQEIRNNHLRITVIEGYFSRVRVHNASKSPDLMVSGLWPGEAIKLTTLERSLLLLSDIPGIAVQSTLKSGGATGTADLYIDIRDDEPYVGVVSLDNYGSHSTGENRINGLLSIYNPLGVGDSLSFRATTTDENLYFGGIDYQIPVGIDGTKFGVSYNHLDYTLGSNFESLDAHGTADILSLETAYPFVRTRLFSLYGKLSGTAQQLHDYVDLYSESTEKSTMGLALSLYGSNRDFFLGGGSNSFSLSINSGYLDIESGPSQLLDDVTAETQGSYSILDIDVQRSHYLGNRFSLYSKLSAQLATKNLTSAEKFSLGGPFGVRAYPQGEATGDEGALVSIEFRYGVSEQMKLSVFTDAGYITVNRDPWAPGANHRDLYSYGMGMEWSTESGFLLQATIAWKAGNDEPTADVDRVPRVWGQIAYRL